MNYKEMYQRKLVSVEEALGHIKSKQEVVTALCGCEPVTLLSNLHTIKNRVENVSVVNAMMQGKYEFFMNPEMKGHFLLNSWFYSHGPRAAHPRNCFLCTPAIASVQQNRMGYRKPDVFLRCFPWINMVIFFSLCTVLEKDFVENADIVIMEVNPNLPRTFGDTHVHISEIDYLVEVDAQVPTLDQPVLTEKDLLIGNYAADLVEDGSTIQIGFGNITGAIAQCLSDKKDLGVHSEMFTDSILSLYEAGAITNRKKTLWKDKFVTDAALGSRKLYDFLDENMSVEFHRGSVVNDPAIIARNNKMVSINAALQMDLTGQCCAESFGLQLYSGTGGHKEFITGAVDSPGGMSILAFYSSAKGDSISRIVPWFEPGTIVTTSRIDVDYVVTEYGVACLRGRSVRERVQELINIAHPNFRDELRFEANRNMIW